MSDQQAAPEPVLKDESQNASDQLSNGGEKSEAKKRKEAKKAEKDAKFKAKMEKKAQVTKQSGKEATGKPKDDKKKPKEVTKYDKAVKEGEEKDLSGPMPAAYSPDYVEVCWYSWWKKSGFFKPEINAPEGDISKDNGKGKFVMVIPPPNVTGTLHLGHALTFAIEDAVTRWNRMKGKVTLWVPGCDHAGIATQNVVERKLQREGKTRHDIGRDKFIEEVWKWKDEKGNRIYDQIGLMGCSVDWDRATFTMDPKMSTAVSEAFIRLHDEGLIYRAKRLVNWCCTLNSAISDIEVEKHELKGPQNFRVPGYGDEIVEFGILELFAYPVEGSDEKIIVSTTRLETMLGDTAVAVHPNDERYKHLKGKFVLHPLIDRRIPIIFDDFVEMEFGTGAVKITPAHDHTDYEVGKRHNLPLIDILDDEGKIAPGFGKFSAMKRFHARKAIAKQLDSLGLYHGTKPNPMVVPTCMRSKDIIEPRLKDQWFVDCKEMGQKASLAVSTGKLEIIPDSHKKTWYHWLENIQDWCISRQIWWGHRIPAYKVTGDGVPPDTWISAVNEQQANEKASKKFNIPPEKLFLHQDEDVLDTWFSSGLFPFAVFGWPDQTKDLKCFYPGDLLETGQDILFFWVARMVMLGTKFLGELPFKKIYLHSMVRDAHGRKMSKSLGNIIDPVDVIRGKSLQELQKMLDESNLQPSEIARAKAAQKIDFPDGIPPCGTDALRFTLCDYTGQGRDINLDIKRVEGYRSFCNKLWNAVKFTLDKLQPVEDNERTFRPLQKHVLTGKETRLDMWLLSRLYTATEACNKGFEKYDFHLATSSCHRLWVYEICDIYLECTKPTFRGDNEEAKEIIRQTLYTACDIGLRLLHPFMPFLTEELYKRLPRREASSPPSLCITSYPEVKDMGWKKDTQLEDEFSFMYDFVHKIRSRKANYGVEKKQVPLYVSCDSEKTKERLLSFVDPITCLTHCSSMETIDTTNPPPEGVPIPISDSCQAYLKLKGIIDINKEIESLKQKKEKREQILKNLMVSINEPNYQEKVPAEVQATHKQKLEEIHGELLKIIKAIEDFSIIIN